MPCFCEEHGNNVGFCNLRPVNVLLSRSTPHDDMCSCQTHENLISLTNALLPPCSTALGSGLLRMQFVDLRKDACSINVQLAKMASKTLVTKLKCLDGRKQQLMID